MVRQVENNVLESQPEGASENFTSSCTIASIKQLIEEKHS